MPNIILTAVWSAYNFRKITMYIIKINLYLKKQTETVTKQIVFKILWKPMKSFNMGSKPDKNTLQKDY